MRTKNKVIVFLAVVVCVMTVAYAAFSANIIISGTANISSEWKVLFTNIEEVSKSTGVNIKNTPQVNGTTATFDIGLSSPGDSIEYRITVSNQGTLDAIIENIDAGETGNEAIIFEISNIKTGDILKAKASTTFNIKITYDPKINTQPEELENKLTIDVTYAQHMGQNIESSTPTINKNVLTKLNGTNSLTLDKSVGLALNNYVISGNSIQNGTPTPENPIEIQSVGERTKNLLNNHDVNETAATPGSLTGTVINSEYIDVVRQTKFDYNVIPVTLEAGKNYTLWAEITVYDRPEEEKDSTVVYFGFRNITSASEMISIYSNTVTTKLFNFSVAENTTENLMLYANYGSTVPGKVRFKTMLLEGTYTAENLPDYEPYGYKIPVKVSENLFDETTAILNKYINASGVEATSPNFLRTDYFDVLSNTKYVLSFHTSNKNIVAFSWYDENKNFISRTSSATTDTSDVNFVATSPSNAKYGICNIFADAKDVVITKESAITTTNIYLDEPLRKIGNYADYIDFAKKKIVRNIYSEYINEVGFISSDNDTYKKFLSNISQKPLLVGTGIQAIGYAMSNKFGISAQEYRILGNYSNLIQPYITSANVNRIAYTFDDNAITTIEQANSKIGDGFEIYYVVDEAIEKTIELPMIYTLEGNNIITVISNNGVSVPISVDYYKIS